MYSWKRQKKKDFAHENSYELITDYIIDDGETHPIAVICPGGGYSVVCSFVEGIPYAKELNKMGISAAILYYRVREKAMYPAPQEDLAKAVKYLFDNQEKYRIDMSNYSVWGSSAGGHLAGSFGTKNMGYEQFNLPEPDCIVLTYPVVSMHKELTHLETRGHIIGKDADFERETFTSIDENIDFDYPRTFVWCGDADTTVQPENSKRLAKALDKANVPYVFEIYPKVVHGSGLGKRTAAEGWIKKAADFWLKK